MTKLLSLEPTKVLESSYALRHTPRVKMTSLLEKAGLIAEHTPEYNLEVIVDKKSKPDKLRQCSDRSRPKRF